MVHLLHWISIFRNPGFFSFLTLFFFFLSLPAQDAGCGTSLSNQDLQAVFQLNQKRKDPQRPELHPRKRINFPVKLYLMRDDEGNNGISQEAALNALDQVNNFFQEINVQFSSCENPREINRTRFLNFSSEDEARLLENYYDSSALNVYFVNNLQNSEGTDLCGYTYFPNQNRRAIFIRNDCAVNGTTLSHEFGHAFFLLHTHGQYNDQLTDERVDGSNCQDAGDFICDTPADPNLDNKVDAACQYIGTEVDSAGDAFMPDPRNIMSYSRKSCRDLFSSEQYEIMALVYESYYEDVACQTQVESVCDSDREALIELYNATGGTQWNNPWNLDLPMTDWAGVGLNESGCVSSLNLAGRNLRGSLPDLNLPELDSLWLNDNLLEGPLPNFSGIPQLVFLELAFNEIGGSLPDFSNLPQLQVLDLNKNRLSGTLPDFSNLPQLRQLFLWDNELEGSIPDFGNLSQLEILQLGANRFSGEIPEFGNMPHLQILDLWVNQLSGAVPNLNLPSLIKLDFSNNQVADLPALTGLPQLQELVVNNNRLDMEDLVPNVNKASITYKYVPQATVGESQELTATAGELADLMLNLPPYPEGTEYNWYKDGEFAGQSPEGQYRLETVTPEDAGTYTCIMTHPDLPGLELEAAPISLSVIAAPFLSASPSSVTVDPLVSDLLITVQANVSWETQFAPGNLSAVEPASGTGNATLTLSFPPNEGPGEKVRSLLLRGEGLEQQIEITQLAPTMSVDQTILEVEAGAGEIVLQISSNYSWEVKALGNDSWITAEPLSGVSDGTLTLLFEANASNKTRSAAFQVVAGNLPPVRIDLNQAGSSACEDDRESLVALYDATNGPNWEVKWNLDAPMNSWYGIRMDEEGCVTHLDLAENRLEGNLPVLNLPRLRILHLENNSLGGTLPQLNTPSLDSIWVFNNGFTGEIPDLQYPNLRYLELAINQFEGSIPDFSGMSRLEVLDLSQNKLSGALPDFSDLPLLERLVVWSNGLSGSIPNFSKLPNLEILQLGRNQLRGPVPDFNQLKRLTVLDLWVNQLSGALPTYDLPQLQKLDVSNNQLSDIANLGELPALNQLVTFNNRLTFEDVLPHLAVPRSQYTYSPQAMIGQNLPDTILLNEGDTFILDLGIDPDVTGNAYQWYKNDQPVAFTNQNFLPLNELTLEDAGTYQCIVSNPGAPDLVLTSKTVEVGVIAVAPTCREENRRELIQLYRQTEGESWSQPWDTTLSLAQWHGVRLNEQGCVVGLRLRNNKLRGTLPDLNLPQLTTLDLGQNELGGQMPDFQYFSVLDSLSLDNNLFNFELPDFSGMPQLTFLNLAGNKLGYGIPNFSQLPELTLMDLSQNEFLGRIPDFDALPNLRVLYLWENKLFGELPNFSGMPALEVLQVGRNKLSGNIPDFDLLPELRVLDLWENEFQGSLPAFGRLPKLRKLDVSNNFLSDASGLSGSPGLEILVVFNNLLTFEDVLPNMGRPRQTHTYAPQAQVGRQQTQILEVGDSFVWELGIDRDVQDNRYSWYKNGEFYASTNEGRLIISSVDKEDTGIYHCEITNPNAPQLTLQSRTQTLLVENPVCLRLDFSHGIEGQTVSFLNHSTGDGLSYFWEFGDENTSTSFQPTHTYADPGQYTVCLTVSNACGSETLCQEIRLLDCEKEGLAYQWAQFLPANGEDLAWDKSGRMLMAGAEGVYIYQPEGGLVQTLDIQGANCNQVAVTAAGEIVVGGNFEGTIDFDPNGSGFMNSSTGETDFFLAKYQADGRLVYAHTFGSSGEEVLGGLEVDIAGNAYITGFFEENFDADPGVGETLLTNRGFRDMFFAKYSASGNLVFAYAIGGSRFDQANGLSLGPDNRIFNTGTFESFEVDFDPGPERVPAKVQAENNYFTAIYDQNGRYREHYLHGSPGLGGTGIAIHASPDGQVLSGGAMYISPVSWGLYLARHDSTAQAVFTHQINSQRSFSRTRDWVQDVITDAYGRTVAIGNFGFAADFDPGEGLAKVENAGVSNPFIAIYSPSGAYEYAFSPPIIAPLGGGLSEAKAVAMDPAGNIYWLVNIDGESVDFDPGEQRQSFTQNGSYLIKYSPVCVSAACQLVAEVANSQDAACGQANGAITLTVSGASDDFSVAWNTGQEGLFVDQLAAGEYQATVSDSRGCQTLVSATIENQDGPDISIEDVVPTRCGQHNGSATVLVEGGTSPFTFSWSDGQQAATAINLNSGKHNVTVVDDNGCISIGTVDIPDSEGPIAQIDSVENASCDNPNGQAFASASGGAGDYAFVWDDGQVGHIASNLAAGTYVVTVFDEAGCSDQAEITVENTYGPSLDIAEKGDANCGISNGYIRLNIEGGTSPYDIAWNDGQTSPLASGLGDGVYIATVTDAKACVSRISTSITQEGGSPPQADFFYEADEQTVNFFNASDGASSLLWIFEISETEIYFARVPDPVFTFDTTGIFSVSLVAENPCGMDTLTQVLDLRTPTSAPGELDGKLSLYPNPTWGKTHLAWLSLSSGTARLVLSNVLGQRMWQKEALISQGNNRLPISFEELPSGAYFLQVSLNDKVGMIKVQIAR